MFLLSFLNQFLGQVTKMERLNSEIKRSFYKLEVEVGTDSIKTVSRLRYLLID